MTLLLFAATYIFFFCNVTPTPETYTLSLHDALPISRGIERVATDLRAGPRTPLAAPQQAARERGAGARDRKSTRLNSSHLGISYAVFCLKKKKQTRHMIYTLNEGSHTNTY